MSEITRPFHTILERLFLLQDRAASPKRLDLSEVYLCGDIAQGGWAVAEPLWLDTTIDHSAGAVTEILIPYEDTEDWIYRILAMQFHYVAGTTAASITPQLKTPSGVQLSFGINSGFTPGEKVYAYDAQNTARQNFGYMRNAIIPPQSEFSVYLGSGGAGATASTLRVNYLKLPRGVALPQ